MTLCFLTGRASSSCSTAIASVAGVAICTVQVDDDQHVCEWHYQSYMNKRLTVSVVLLALTFLTGLAVAMVCTGIASAFFSAAMATSPSSSLFRFSVVTLCIFIFFFMGCVSASSSPSSIIARLTFREEAAAGKETGALDEARVAA